jgi:hypothetical protein
MLGVLTIVPRRPAPIKISLPVVPDLTEYEAVAEVLKFRPRQMVRQAVDEKRRELLGFMLDQGMPIYDNRKVGRRRTFVWARLDGFGSDRYRNDNNHRWATKDGELHIVRDGEHGLFIENQYKHAVPLDILKRATSIRKQFADAAFYVSDYAAVDPDPFICVRRGDPRGEVTEHVVFGVWDEPGFGAIGRDAK